MTAREGIRTKLRNLPLAAGAVLASEGKDIAVYGVEPLGCDSLASSLSRGERITVPPAVTLADRRKPSCVGRLPFEIVRESRTSSRA